MSEKIRVGILGATGAVGQRFAQLLENHPWFAVTALSASERSAGKPYTEAVNWRLDTPIPSELAGMVVSACEPNLPCDVVFSGLDSSVAGPIEEQFATAGYAVISNSRNHRMDEDVPLLIPEVNPDHTAIIPHQRRRRGYGRGFIATNPNCSTVGLTMALKPLADRFGVRQVSVATMQALSGAGYPGVSSMDVLDNVLPYIKDEEEKMEREPLKLLGRCDGERFEPLVLTVSAQCNRVHVLDGHLECVSVKLEKKAEPEEVNDAFRTFSGLPQALGLPFAPARPIVLREEADRPQPRFDRDTEHGMAVVVGRVRPCRLLDFKFLALVHNTIRGAAGAAVLNAELLKAQGYIGA
ncbi:MAG: aspartate-semialdehyde dehydrogenase [candidate division Zixibacteria bacterium]|nr:aspartate-semialdehyde dehydrogenase [candidate division Zixibacteria bacterium]